MPYKDQEKKRDYQRRYNRKYRAAHKEEADARVRRWRASHKEEYNAWQREWYARHLEERRAYQRRKYAERKGRVLDEENESHEEEQMQVIAKMETCPKCGSPGALKVSGMYYLAGCSKPGCKYFEGRDPESGFASSGTTAAAAVEGWNKLARELREELGGKAVPVPAAAEEEAGTADEPAEPTDQDEAAEEEAAAAEEEESAEEEAGGDGDGEEERSEQFWLELDGTFYRLDDGVEGCEGCVFRLMFGSRVVCAAKGSTGFEQAAELCKGRDGVWRENSEE